MDICLGHFVGLGVQTNWTLLASCCLHSSSPVFPALQLSLRLISFTSRDLSDLTVQAFSLGITRIQGHQRALFIR